MKNQIKLISLSFLFVATVLVGVMFARVFNGEHRGSRNVATPPGAGPYLRDDWVGPDMRHCRAVHYIVDFTDHRYPPLRIGTSLRIWVLDRQKPIKHHLMDVSINQQGPVGVRIDRPFASSHFDKVGPHGEVSFILERAPWPDGKPAVSINSTAVKYDMAD